MCSTVCAAKGVLCLCEGSLGAREVAGDGLPTGCGEGVTPRLEVAAALEQEQPLDQKDGDETAKKDEDGAAPTMAAGGAFVQAD